jgi:hypothetical protein
MTISFLWSRSVPQTQFCREFIQGMLNRDIVGFYRHGDIGTANTRGKNVPEMLERRWRRYRKTGNRELLMDVANLAMSEYMDPSHPKAHFAPEDSGR